MPDPCVLFPFDITHEVFRYLDIKDWFSCQRVSKKWRKFIVTDSSLWSCKIDITCTTDSEEKKRAIRRNMFERSLNYALENNTQPGSSRAPTTINYITHIFDWSDAQAYETLCLISKDNQSLERINNLFIDIYYAEHILLTAYLGGYNIDYDGYHSKCTSAFYNLAPITNLKFRCIREDRPIVLNAILDSQKTTLEGLWLDSPLAITEPLPIYPLLKKFTGFSVSNNLSYVYNFPNLTHLDLKGPGVVHADQLFMKCRSLKFLDLSRVVIQALSDELFCPENLTSLVLHEIDLVSLLGSLKKLKYLRFIRVLPVLREHVLGVTQLFKEFECGRDLEKLALVGSFDDDWTNCSCPKLKELIIGDFGTELGESFLSQCTSNFKHVEKISLFHVESKKDELIEILVELSANNLKCLTVTPGLYLTSSDIERLSNVGVEVVYEDRRMV